MDIWLLYGLPYTIHCSNADGEKVVSLHCVISDDLKHNVCMVYKTQKSVIAFIKESYPQIKGIHYFSDGCAGHYKNKYNFVNLSVHEEDFQVKAQWSFFMTSQKQNRMWWRNSKMTSPKGKFPETSWETNHSTNWLIKFFVNLCHWSQSLFCFKRISRFNPFCPWKSLLRCWSAIWNKEFSQLQTIIFFRNSCD